MLEESGLDVQVKAVSEFSVKSAGHIGAMRILHLDADPNQIPAVRPFY